jgi:hypothetical protein
VVEVAFTLKNKGKIVVMKREVRPEMALECGNYSACAE